MESNRYYLVGRADVLRLLFPDYSGNDERFSLDGTQVIYEVRFTDEQRDTFISDNPNVKVLTHAEALELLHSPESEGIWYKKPVAMESEE
ncbi:MAG TPA: hypothetical protein VNN76_11510 [Bacteroidota bacterium]|nr:hypothetical protein [Bacteroidota bacterium]